MIERQQIVDHRHHPIPIEKKVESHNRHDDKKDEDVDQAQRRTDEPIQ